MKFYKEEKEFIFLSIIIQFFIVTFIYPEFSLFNKFIVAIFITIIGWLFIYRILIPFYKFIYNYLKIVLKPPMIRISDKYLR